MFEYVLDDGRKAEKVENNLDSLTKVTEVYVEPKLQKKLSQRITERLCVCEREIETLDETTGEVINRVVERVCGDSVVGSHATASQKSQMQLEVEKKIQNKMNIGKYLFVALIILQVAALSYVVFLM